jgi:hypothetical protein
MKHYVLLSYLGDSDELVDAQVSVVSGPSTLKAFDVAIGNYRKTNNLPRSKHINCRKLKEYDTKKEADDFYDWFLEEIRKDQKMKRKAGAFDDE